MNLRRYARGKPCMVRIPGVCSHNPETTVLAHLGGAGMALKQNDLLAAWCCSDCHDAVDGRTHAGHPVLIDRFFIDGIIRTQQALLDSGMDEVINKWARGLKL